MAALPPAQTNDRAGANLWVLNGFDGDLQEYAPSQIKSSGSPTPKVVLSGAAAESTYQITVGPALGH
jgi:hypothetical protein